MLWGLPVWGFWGGRLATAPLGVFNPSLYSYPGHRLSDQALNELHRDYESRCRSDLAGFKLLVQTEPWNWQLHGFVFPDERPGLTRKVFLSQMRINYRKVDRR